MKVRKTLPGFSLLEIAIVLCIIGIVGGFGLPALTNMLKQQKINRTEQHLTQISQALAGYVLSHKHLPCAAAPGASGELAGASEDNRVIGLVPYRTLGLPESVAKDGHHHWVTYAVVPELTGTKHLMMPQTDDSPERVFCEIRSPIAEIQVHNQQGESVLSADIRGDFIACFLIGHGPKGDGSFTDAGSRRPTLSHDKAVNAADDLVFIDRLPSADPDNFFDDTVRWITRNNLMAIYGQKPCQKRDDSNHPLD